MRAVVWALVAVAGAGCDDEAGAGGDGAPQQRRARDGAVAPRDPAPRPADAAAAVDAVGFRDAEPLVDARPTPAPDAAALAGDATPPPKDAAPPAPDAAPPEIAPVRFIAMGDTGEGNDRQRRVAAAIADVCAERGGCDLVLLLGDNIYDSGVTGVDDPQWQTKFEQPYAELDLPFYATLGNHDYGAPDFLNDFAGGLGIDPTRGQAQIDYARVSPKFRMPATFYRFEVGPVEFVCLNTTAIFWEDLEIVATLTGFDVEADRQRATLPMWEAESRAPWRVAYGHHPYRSNGRHGNAGSYDFVFIEGLIGSGTHIRDFLEEHVLGRFDVYFSGHDHNLQDHGAVQGTQVIVSGAGAKTTELIGFNPTLWQDEQPGFVLVEADAREMTFTFVIVHEEAGDPAWEIAHTRRVAAP